MNFPFFLHKNNYFPYNVSLSFHCLSFLYCFQDFSPAAPSAALAAPEGPYLATVGTPVAAAHVAAHWRSSPLVVVVGGPDPRPRCDGGSWPESQSGVGGGTGRGGEVGGCPAAAPLFLAGAGAGTMDSSRNLLFAGSPSSPPVARSAISFLAATLLVLDVRWTLSPAQMLVPSTVVRS
jgi:hypothetical protein